MRIKFDDLLGFVKVAELGGFHKAAEALFISPSALSQRIRKLEECVGAKLLDRTTRSTELTVVGREFLPMAQRSIRIFNKTVDDIEDVIQVRSGSISVAANTTTSETLMPRVVDYFCSANKGVKVRLNDMTGPEVAEAVAIGEAELGVARLTEQNPALNFEPLYVDKFHVLCKADHPLASRKAVNWTDLADYPIIEMRPNTGASRDIARALVGWDLHLTHRCEVYHSAVQLSLVARGLGIAAAPGLTLLKRPDLGLVARPLENPVIETKLGIITLRGRALSPAAVSFAGFIRQGILEVAEDFRTLMAE
jgi:DNA-binding transcriptional LysR family regulator